MYLLSQIVVAACFLVLIIVLFFDEQDYLSFSVFLMLIAGIVSAIEIEEARHLEGYIDAIEWEVVFFLIAMFTIVEILNEARLFHTIARWIVKKFKNNIRTMFYAICIVSTLAASIIEDLSVAIIFIPIIILTCDELEINPAPFLLGMTICINIASTLTPFGSPENIIIAINFDLNLWDFVSRLGLYFVITTALTLFLLDKLVLSKNLDEKWTSQCEDGDYTDKQSPEFDPLHDVTIESKVVIKNLIGFVIFIILLIVIEEIYVVGLIGMVLFVFLNAEKKENGHYHPQLSRYLSKVDYKLIYFFMCLFILVFLMEKNGTVELIEIQFERFNSSNIFWLSVILLIVTSLLSGFLDNAPVTIIFLPIINILSDGATGELTPLLMAFILGINLGGNFLPQGSACDMMTLELSRKHCVNDLTYRRLTKIGGLFALLHILLGIGYLAAVIYL